MRSGLCRHHLIGLVRVVVGHFPFAFSLDHFNGSPILEARALIAGTDSIQFCCDHFGAGVRFRHSAKEVILLWSTGSWEVQPCNYYFLFAFRPGGERANLILSERARLRTASGVRLSRVAIAAVLSPAAAIDRSSPSFSGVHGDPGAVISSPSARARLGGLG
jgi:hypothetical protein